MTCGSAVIRVSSFMCAPPATTRSIGSPNSRAGQRPTAWLQRRASFQRVRCKLWFGVFSPRATHPLKRTDNDIVVGRIAAHHATFRGAKLAAVEDEIDSAAKRSPEHPEVVCRHGVCIVADRTRTVHEAAALQVFWTCAACVGIEVTQYDGGRCGLKVFQHLIELASMHPPLMHNLPGHLQFVGQRPRAHRIEMNSDQLHRMIEELDLCKSEPIQPVVGGFVVCIPQRQT